jgi:phospholipase/lecithinase/hemolysin
MIQHLSAEYTDVSCFRYSSFKLMTNILDNPVEYGFEERDARKLGGGIWADHVHLTSAVHEWLARDIREYLTTL